MALIKPYVDQLLEDRDTLADNISAKGVPVEEDETITSLANKVADIDKSPFTGHYDAEGLATIGWTTDDIAYYQQNGVQWNEEDDNYFKLTASELAGDDSSNTRFLPKNSTNKNIRYYYKLLAIPLIEGKYNGDFNHDLSLTTIPLIDTSLKNSFSDMFGDCHNLITIPLIDTSNGTNFSSMFQGCVSLKTIPLINTSSGTNFSGMFNKCHSFERMSLINTSSGTNFSGMFTECYALESIPQLDTSSGTNFSSMFSYCKTLKLLPQLDTGLGTDFSYMFNNCMSLRTIPQLDTSSGTNFAYMFQSCESIIDIPLINTSSGTNFKYMFNNCTSLTNLGGLQNIGQAYDTSQSASYSNYTLGLSVCFLLTHDSLMNVINNLYDIATAGVQPQQLILGNTNKAKLTAEEIAIATNKGWLVS